MKFLLLSVFLVAALIGWAGLLLLDEHALTAAMITAALVTIVLGWTVTFQQRAMRFRGWFGFVWGGGLEPVRERWIAPLRAGWALLLLALSTGLMMGAIAHVLLLMRA